ncbi:MAG: hypothetical protein JST65_06990 [Acidobacteria bacterium]|nr:hypothetical protein [Acidobacteriota bacterium]
MYAPILFSQPAKFKAAVKRAVRCLKPDVVDVSYTFGEDWNGGPSVFFMVILSNAASSQRENLFQVTDRASKMIDFVVQPAENWGVYPYFNFRSEAEQAELNQKALAS